MNTPRIIQYFPDIRVEMGGVVRTVLDLCAVLAERGNDVVLVAGDTPDIPREWDGRPGKPKFVSLPPTGKLPLLAGSKAARVWHDVLQGGGVAHLHGPWTASNIPMARMCRGMGVPYVVSIHGMLDDWAMGQRNFKKKIFLSLLGRRYLRAAARLHYTAAAERQQAERRVPGSIGVVLPCLVDLSPFQNLPGPGPARAAFPACGGEDAKLLLLSRLNEGKGVHILIAAAALLRQKGRRFKLLIAGAGSAAYESRLREQTRQLHLEDITSFLGGVHGVEKISLYQSADLFVLPTEHENFGLVLIEALAAGTTVVTTRGTHIWEDITAAGGTIVPAEPAAITEALDRLLGNREQVSAKGQQGRRWVMDHLSTEKLAARYESLYSEVCRETAAGSAPARSASV